MPSDVGLPDRSTREAPAPDARQTPWGPYVPPGAGRDERIDLLRGFAVVAMVVDHIGGPSFLYAITGGNRFYTSAAEGFIFISGLVMGLVYRRFIERDGLGASLHRAIERAFALYLVTITLTLFFIPVSEILDLHWAQGVDLSDPAAFLVSVLALHRTYYLVDIPLLYTVLILVSPLALVLLAQGRAAIVLGVSWLLWGAFQFFPDETDIPWTIAGNYLFFLSAWQVFFFTGLVLGWHHESLTTRLAGFPRRAALIASAVGAGGLVLLYWATSRLTQFFGDDAATADSVLELELFLLEFVFGKADVRPGRIVASTIVFLFLYLLVTEAWRPLYRGLGWFLLPLGESALYAYAAHVVIAVPIAFVLDSATIPEQWGRPLNAAVQIATLGLLWLLIKGGVLFVNPSRGAARYAWPAGMAVACLVLLPLDPTPSTPGLGAREFEADPYAARVARVFGTPVPGRPPASEGTAVPLPPPRPSLRQAQLPALTSEARVSRYVGDLTGSLQNIQFFSPALQRDMRYFVYLPPGYEEEGRRYPVLVMLHGNSGSYEEWLAYGLISGADRLIAAREILPVIIVLPQGDFSYWVNHAGNGPRWGDYLTTDLVRHIRATYRTLPGGEHRAVGGLSMGATGALVNAFRNPDVFGIVGAHSPALPEDDGSRDFLGRGHEFAQQDPVSLARTAGQLHRLRIWIDVGDEDSWLDRVELFHEVLEARGINHDWNVLPGDHWGPYWAEHVPSYLRFYDAALNPERRR
jgi:enterochelin esterase-like enzyme